jgi:hypothetical protein
MSDWRERDSAQTWAPKFWRGEQCPRPSDPASMLLDRRRIQEREDLRGGRTFDMRPGLIAGRGTAVKTSLNFVSSGSHTGPLWNETTYSAEQWYNAGDHTIPWRHTRIVSIEPTVVHFDAYMYDRYTTYTASCSPHVHFTLEWLSSAGVVLTSFFFGTWAMQNWLEADYWGVLLSHVNSLKDIHPSSCGVRLRTEAETGKWEGTSYQQYLAWDAAFAIHLITP